MVDEAVQTPDAATLDAVFAALSHSARRTVLATLAVSSTAWTMKDLAAESGMSPQLLHKHVTSLERAGLVAREARGRETVAVVRPEALEPATEWIASMHEFWHVQLDALGDYVDVMQRTQARDDPALACAHVPGRC